MAHHKRSGSKGKIAAAAVLALICIGGTELAACRMFAPELFDQITRPVAALFQQLSAAGGRLAEQVFSPGESDEPPVSQLAGAPSIEEAAPMEDPAITELTFRNGREVLTGGVVEMIYYNQGEAPWADQLYGSDPISGYGCGPTAMAMVVSSLTSQIVDPADMAGWACEQGYWAPGSGSYYGLISGAAQAYGFTAEGWSDWSADSLCRELASGHLFVALMGPGHFTSAGHFIVLRGVTLSGKILVADPNSRERSLTAWEPEVILEELPASRGSGAPLWRLSL